MNRRLVCTLEWLTLLPATGPLPQISQRFAMGCWSFANTVRARRHLPDGSFGAGPGGSDRDL